MIEIFDDIIPSVPITPRLSLDTEIDPIGPPILTVEIFNVRLILNVYYKDIPNLKPAIPQMDIDDDYEPPMAFFKQFLEGETIEPFGPIISTVAESTTDLAIDFDLSPTIPLVLVYIVDDFEPSGPKIPKVRKPTRQNKIDVDREPNKPKLQPLRPGDIEDRTSERVEALTITTPFREIVDDDEPATPNVPPRILDDEEATVPATKILDMIETQTPIDVEDYPAIPLVLVYIKDDELLTVPQIPVLVQKPQLEIEFENVPFRPLTKIKKVPKPQPTLEILREKAPKQPVTNRTIFRIIRRPKGTAYDPGSARPRTNSVPLPAKKDYPPFRKTILNQFDNTFFYDEEMNHQDSDNN